jgi:hypothetical protein
MNIENQIEELNERKNNRGEPWYSTTFQTNMGSEIQRICRELKEIKRNHSYDRLCFAGTIKEWTLVYTVLEYRRSISKGSQKRSYTAAMQRIYRFTMQGTIESIKRDSQRKAKWEARDYADCINYFINTLEQ